MKQLVFKTNSALETQKKAFKILPFLENINVICLYGPLGAGKTCFSQGMAKALGVEKRVISPTFILLKEYDLKNKENKTIFTKLYHLDCYKIRDNKDIKSVSLTELWQNPKNLILIEWAEKVAAILPKERIDIKFKYLSLGERKIKVDINN
ncbi:tRNA (adenosine(37)-N6)-threonylcarbamoyltransferase complex ATPase subunit type 1 TsaE [Patescibacteria group bacterium]